LLALRSRGCSVRRSNAYLTALKSFFNWMVKDKRASENPLAHLSAGNQDTDRRHDRRELETGELRSLLTATRESRRLFRGLSGPERFHLYAVACGTGFRASTLASLTPESFDLENDRPTVTAAARNIKNRKTKVQPLSADVAELLRAYLEGKPAGQPIWPGTWASKRRAAEMVRLDLEAAGIPYVIDGPDGPLFADFHALRHTYLTLGARAGIDLRTLQELAGHSTPALTARYSHRRLHDLAGAVEKLPNFLPEKIPAEALKATGTDGASPSAYTRLTRTLDGEVGRLMADDGYDPGESENTTGLKLLNLQEVKAGKCLLMASEGRVSEGTRTPDSQIHNLEL